MRHKGPRSKNEFARLLQQVRVPLRLAAIAIGAGLVATATGCRTTHPPLDVVDEVDLARYLGRWYEIASFPKHFQRGCVATTATYSRRDDGRIGVVNECRDRSFDGKLRRAEGVAWVADEEGSPAKLKVQFFWPFRGDYWIVALDPEYRYAAVGNPSRDSLWILARTPTLNPSVYRALTARLESLGFDPSRLRLTRQPLDP